MLCELNYNQLLNRRERELTKLTKLNYVNDIIIYDMARLSSDRKVMLIGILLV